MKTLPLFRATKGLNTVSDPAELVHDTKTGEIDLQLAVNVVIERSGKRISRRKGYSVIAAGQFHSGFCNGGDALCIQEHALWASLYRVDVTTSSLVGIRSGLSKGRRMAYCAVNDQIYYSNAVEIGIYENGISHAWAHGDYVGHTTDKELYGPPVGTALDVMDGYMLIGDGPVVWVSEEYDFTAYNLANRYLDLVHDVTMVKVVIDGVWVGTTQETLFLAGHEPERWQVVRRIPYGVKAYGAIPGAVSPGELGLPDLPGDGFLWMSHRGICWGGPGGTFLNFTEQRIDPEALAGLYAAGIIVGNQVVFTIDP